MGRGAAGEGGMGCLCSYGTQYIGVMQGLCMSFMELGLGSTTF